MTPVTYCRPTAAPRSQASHAKGPTLPAGLTGPSAAISQPQAAGTSAAGDARLHEAFSDFVGETFYGQMMQSLRKAYPSRRGSTAAGVKRSSPGNWTRSWPRNLPRPTATS